MDNILKDDARIRSMIVNAHGMIKKQYKYKQIPFWAFVRDLTSFGSTSAIEICNYYGWNAHEDTNKIKL